MLFSLSLAREAGATGAERDFTARGGGGQWRMPFDRLRTVSEVERQIAERQARSAEAGNVKAGNRKEKQRWKLPLG